MRHSKLADKIEEVISEPSKMEIKLKVGGQMRLLPGLSCGC